MRIPFLAPLLALALTQAVPAAAQAAPPADDRWQLTLTDENYIWDVRLVRVDGEELVYRRGADTARVRLMQVREIRLIQKSEFRLGGAAGGALNALTGADDEVYDLGPLEFGDRVRTVQQLLRYHPAR